MKYIINDYCLGKVIGIVILILGVITAAVLILIFVITIALGLQLSKLPLSNHVFYLANDSIIEVDLQKLNSDSDNSALTIKCNKGDPFKGVIYTVLTESKDTWKALPLDEKTLKVYNQSLLHYWDTNHLPRGAIGLYSPNSYIVWS